MSATTQATGAPKRKSTLGATKTKQFKRKRSNAFWRHVANIYRLTIKELRSIRSDPIMLVLVAYSFTFAIYAAATGASTEATNLSIGIVDEDHSDLSRRIADGMTPPTFKSVTEITAPEMDAAMDAQRFLFIIEFPPKFQEDILSGRQPSVQINVDATAVAQASIGKTYIQNVIVNYVTEFITGRAGLTAMPIKVDTIARFNPNLKSSWFNSVMQIINNLTMLTIILTGAALIRERELGTVEHLLVMPVVPAEIMLSKSLANGIVILAAAGLSLLFVVQGGSCFYVFTVAALGILLGTVASTMGQFGLLAIPVILVLMLLSGTTTPMESMPVWLQYLMKVISPTPHFVTFAQDVLYRGADLSIVWTEILAMAAIGAVYFVFGLRRFRHVIFGT
jgi:ABC-2 type transport system permease protein